MARRIESAHNALLQRLRRLVASPGAYRKLGQLWLEGEHLCAAARERGLRPPLALATDDALGEPRLAGLAHAADELVILPAALFAKLSGLASPAALAYVLDMPAASAPVAGQVSLVLDGVQDAGNVGSLLRSASAFGVRQVLALAGTAGLWSPKVMRAGMGAQFNLRLCEGLRPESLDGLGLELVATSSHAPSCLHEADLPAGVSWVLGHEGQGVSGEVAARCRHTVRIAQPGGEESLNVAAAGAICLHESLRRNWPAAAATAAPKAQ